MTEEQELEQLAAEIAALEEQAKESAAAKLTTESTEFTETTTDVDAPKELTAAVVSEVQIAPVASSKPKPKPKAKVKAEKAPEPKPEPPAANTTPLFGAARIKSKLVGYQRK